MFDLIQHVIPHHAQQNNNPLESFDGEEEVPLVTPLMDIWLDYDKKWVFEITATKKGDELTPRNNGSPYSSGVFCLSS